MFERSSSGNPPATEKPCPLAIIEGLVWALLCDFRFLRLVADAVGTLQCFAGHPACRVRQGSQWFTYLQVQLQSGFEPYPGDSVPSQRIPPPPHSLLMLCHFPSGTDSVAEELCRGLKMIRPLTQWPPYSDSRYSSPIAAQQLAAATMLTFMARDPEATRRSEVHAEATKSRRLAQVAPQSDDLGISLTAVPRAQQRVPYWLCGPILPFLP